ncbi:predicted protein [Histoplasma capsulatum H143]|uniref:Uncharacterized protein n=1 Tax=Ajellomyces capsulatus (strain H143) TaxID=544712 RepID=C6H452_AJECH|nr:predicted protein [Histoplasma capsulatum H143]
MPNSSQNIGGHVHSPRASATSKPPSPALPPPTQQISPIPAFYFYRENGVAVPLIALDELPAWLRIGREDWFRPEWQQYMSPVNDQSTIRVGEYEVFAKWGGAVYQLPMWRLVGERNYEAGDGAAAGAGWEVDASERRGGEVMFHLDRGNGYDSVADARVVDNGYSNGEGNSSGYTEEGRTGDRNAVWDEDGEQIADREVNREGGVQDIQNAPLFLPAGVSNCTCDGGAEEGFSYFNLPFSRNDHNQFYSYQPLYQQHSSPHQQTSMSHTPLTWAPELCRSLSNNSYNSANQNLLHSLASNTDTETSLSSWSSFDAPQPVFNVPIIPRAPLGLGLTKSAPSYVFWGPHPADFRAWPAGTADGNSSVRSV